MAALVVAEHDNRALKPATLNAVAAASEIAPGEVDILVTGKDCRGVAEGAADDEPECKGRRPRTRAPEPDEEQHDRGKRDCKKHIALNLGRGAQQ